jgi:hypothetical protein
MDPRSLALLDELALKVPARVMRRSATAPDLQALRDGLRVPPFSEQHHIERFFTPEHLFPILAHRLDEIRKYIEYLGKP